MKKTIALLLLSVVSFTAVSAQDKPAKGELIYGRVMGIDGPLAGIHVTEKNGYDRIMADGITDANGEFSFRLSNPDNRIEVSRVGYETMDLGIDRKYYEISMKKQKELEPIQMPDNMIDPEEFNFLDVDDYLMVCTRIDPSMFKRYNWESINYEILMWYNRYQLNTLPGNGLTIGFNTYYSIDELFNN
jgi:hypothetical protein